MQQPNSQSLKEIDLSEHSQGERSQGQKNGKGQSQGQGDEKRYKRHGARFKARRRAVDILFEAEFRDLDPVDIAEERQAMSANKELQVKPVPDYTQRIVLGVAENLDAIDQAVATNLSSDWRLDRLPGVDRAVLRVAAWEVMFNPDVDNKVAVVEGIELAAQYSHDKAPGYVNAVLDGVSKYSELKLADEVAAAREAAATAEASGVATAEDQELDQAIDTVLGLDEPTPPESVSADTDVAPEGE